MLRLSLIFFPGHATKNAVTTKTGTRLEASPQNLVPPMAKANAALTDIDMTVTALRLTPLENYGGTQSTKIFSFDFRD